MPSEPAPNRDVRMRGFAHRTTVEAALAWIDHEVQRLPAEHVSLWQAAGRVLAVDVVSEVDVPGFARSMMDGFAVQATDTQGATAYNRLELQIIGQSLAGQSFNGPVQRGQAVRIMTGAPLPVGADAVLPAERVEVVGDKLLVIDEVPQSKNVGQRGEDVATGSTVFRSGRMLRPQDIGLLSSIGRSHVEVVRQPRVRIVVTGNELLPAGSEPAPQRTIDANGPILASLVARDGGLPEVRDQKSEVRDQRSEVRDQKSEIIDQKTGIIDQKSEVGDQKSEVRARPLTSDLRPLDYIVADDPASILTAMQDDADVVLVSGGSSVGQEDHAPAILAANGELSIHGIAMRPSSPTGMGKLGDRIVFLLPGNPVSCLCAYDFFAGRAIRLLGGRRADWPYRQRRLPLARKLVSQVGRVDYARVQIVSDCIEPLAISGASILSSTTSADGFVIVSADSEGYPAGAEVDVYLYD